MSSQPELDAILAAVSDPTRRAIRREEGWTFMVDAIAEHFGPRER